MNARDESRMSVAHCSVGRIAHNFRFLVICVLGCQFDFNGDIKTEK